MMTNNQNPYRVITDDAKDKRIRKSVIQATPQIALNSSVRHWTRSNAFNGGKYLGPELST